MKKLLTILGTLLYLSVSAQNGANEVLPAPASTQPYIVLDTLFTLANYPAQFTEVYVHFANPTGTPVKAVQFRLFYDDVRFSNVEAFWGPVASSITTKYGSFLRSGNWINISVTYTGANQSFGWANGALFKLRLYHSPTYQGVVDPVATTGTSTYTSLATVGSGLDIPLGIHSYGAGFQMTPLTFPIYFRDIKGAPVQGVAAKVSAQLKGSSLPFLTAPVDTTNALGNLSYTVPLDTHYYKLRVQVQSDTLTDGGALNITDAYAINNAVTQQDTLQGGEFFQADINENGNITVSDAFAMFNRIALAANSWNPFFAGKHNVKLVWQNELDAIKAAPAAYVPSMAPARYSIDTVVNSLDSLAIYTYVLGDATGTGYNNQAVIMAKMANPSAGTDYVLDPIVYFSNKTDSVEFRIPKLTLTSDNYVDVPVTMYTFGNKIGAAQIGLKYDTAIFEFVSVNVGPEVAKWTSIIRNNDGELLWAGHEDPFNPSLVEGPTSAFTFTFKVKSILGWRTSPIAIFDKAAGDEEATDMNIRRSPNDGSLINGKAEMDEKTLAMMEGFLVYPNPTQDVVVLEFYTEDFTTLTIAVYDVAGTLVKYIQQDVTETGFQLSFVNLHDLDNGVYFVKGVTNDRQKTYKIIKW